MACFGEAVELGLVPAELQEELGLYRLPDRVDVAHFDEHRAHFHQSLHVRSVRSRKRKEYIIVNQFEFRQ